MCLGSLVIPSFRLQSVCSSHLFSWEYQVADEPRLLSLNNPAKPLYAAFLSTLYWGFTVSPPRPRRSPTDPAGCASFESPFEPSAQCGPPRCLGPVQRSKVWLSPDLISRTWSPTPNFTDRVRLSTSAPTRRRPSSRGTLISIPLKCMGRARPRRWSK